MSLVKRPHYKERIAHAEGHEIETCLKDSGIWVDCRNPEWVEDQKYRVKQPQIVHERHFRWNALDGVISYREHFKFPNNLRLVFSETTGELISAEVIQQS